LTNPVIGRSIKMPVVHPQRDHLNKAGIHEKQNAKSDSRKPFSNIYSFQLFIF
jgi:hypothetical protein